MKRLDQGATGGIYLLLLVLGYNESEFSMTWVDIHITV